MTILLQRELKWRGSPVTTYAGTINKLLAYIPEFERRPFVSGNSSMATDNSFKDMIVRRPLLKQQFSLWNNIFESRCYVLNIQPYFFILQIFVFHGCRKAL